MSQAADQTPTPPQPAIPPPPGPSSGPNAADVPPDAPGYRSRPVPGPGAYAGPVPVSPSDARTMSLLAHVGGIIVGFVAPLVVYLLYKDRDQFVRGHAAEALNFQITVFIAYVAATVTSFVGVGFLLFFAVWVCSIIFAIQGAIAANAGRPYRYPVSIRMLS
ncbi:MAG: DUF4870 domain-containing protein [Dermatophilaceae bacterium]